MNEEHVMVQAPGSPPIEARLAVPAAARAGLVLCHPHPLYGGDMDNPVIARCAEAAQAQAVATLRFNFRGVGRSGGTHDEGRGEADDARAALDALGRRLGLLPLAVLGYSFGAWVAARVAATVPAVRALALVAPPLAMRPLPEGGVPPSTLLVCGTEDPYCPPAELERLRAARPDAVIERIPGADHFFAGALGPLGEAVRGWLGRWVAVTPAGGAGATGSPSRPTG